MSVLAPKGPMPCGVCKFCLSWLGSRSRTGAAECKRVQQLNNKHGRTDVADSWDPLIICRFCQN